MDVMVPLVFQTGQIDALASTRVILALLCVIVASSLALGIAVGLTRRIQQIAGPEDEEPETEKQEPRTKNQEPSEEHRT